MTLTEAPGAAFRESFVEADGFRIRYLEAGQGTPLVHLHGAGGLRLTPAHDLLRQQHRVIAFEMPGFGPSPENTRTRTMADLAGTMAFGITADWDTLPDAPLLAQAIDDSLAELRKAAGK